MKRILFLLRIFTDGLWSIGQFLMVWLMGLLLLLGVLCLLEIATPPRLPVVYAVPLGCGRIKQRTAEEIAAGTTLDHWQQLGRALWILDRVCPEVAEWTRERWECGHLVFDARSIGRYAQYEIFTHTVVIFHCRLEGSDMDIAATLAHEYRHSRQSWRQDAQWMIAEMCGLDGRWFVETEACEFADKIRRAIDGQR